MRVAENKGITLFPVIRNNQPKLSSLSAKKRAILWVALFLFRRWRLTTGRGPCSTSFRKRPAAERRLKQLHHQWSLLHDTNSSTLYRNRASVAFRTTLFDTLMRNYQLSIINLL